MNQIIAKFIEVHNNWLIKRRKYWIDTVDGQSEAGSIFVFGDSSAEDGPRAQRFRMELLERFVEAAMDENIATVVLVRQSQATLLNSLCDGDRVVRAGRDMPWQLFDPRNQPEEVRQMFIESLWAYCRGGSGPFEHLRSWTDFFLDLLTSCMPTEYFSFVNMNLLMTRLIGIDGHSDSWDSRHSVRSFLNWIGDNAHSPVPDGLCRRLNALWNDGLERLTIFWSALNDETRHLTSGTARHTFNDHLRGGGICICAVPDNGQDVATAMLLAQLRAIERMGHGVCLVDYRVRLPKVKDRLLLNGSAERERICVIGDSPRCMGINGEKLTLPSRATIACLGMSAIDDARDVHSLMSGLSRVTAVHVGLGRGGHLGLHKEMLEDITQDQLRLENCPDGQAVIRDVKGYRIVRHIFA